MNKPTVLNIVCKIFLCLLSNIDTKKISYLSSFCVFHPQKNQQNIPRLLSYLLRFDYQTMNYLSNNKVNKIGHRSNTIAVSNIVVTTCHPTLLDTNNLRGLISYMISPPKWIRLMPQTKLETYKGSIKYLIQALLGKSRNLKALLRIGEGGRR